MKIHDYQEKLKGCGIGSHAWSPWHSTSSGLAHECLRCHKVEFAKFYNGELLLNPPLDEDGFLDKSKLKEILKNERL